MGQIPLETTYSYRVIDKKGEITLNKAVLMNIDIDKSIEVNDNHL